MRERLRFSAHGAELPESFVAALARLLALQGSAPSPAAEPAAGHAEACGWIAARRRQFDHPALRQLHRLLAALGEREQWLALGITEAEAEQIDELAAELGSALEAAANIGKTIGRLAARGD